MYGAPLIQYSKAGRGIQPTPTVPEHDEAWMPLDLRVTYRSVGRAPRGGRRTSLSSDVRGEPETAG
jgi:hypothetical protein